MMDDDNDAGFFVRDERVPSLLREAAERSHVSRDLQHHQAHLRAEGETL